MNSRPIRYHDLHTMATLSKSNCQHTQLPSSPYLKYRVAAWLGYSAPLLAEIYLHCDVVDAAIDGGWICCNNRCVNISLVISTGNWVM